MKLHLLIGLMVEAVVITIAAKLMRDLMLKRRGYDVNVLVAEKRSVGAATSQAGYLVGVLLGFLGAVSGLAARPEASFFSVAGAVAFAGLVAIVLQLAADLIGDALIFRGIEDKQNLAEAANTTLAVGKAAVSVATGLVLRGAMSDPEGSLIGRIAWFGLGQGLMVLSVLFYCRLTPYDDVAEIKRNNLAAGFPIAGILLAVGFVMETAISGRATTSTTEALLEGGKFLAVSLILVYAFRRITDFIMLPRVKLARAISEDRNVAAGIQEGVSFVLASLIVTFFLT